MKRKIKIWSNIIFIPMILITMYPLSLMFEKYHFGGFSIFFICFFLGILLGRLSTYIVSKIIQNKETNNIKEEKNEENNIK